MNKNRNDVVSASEIASYEWCPESWRLESLGKEPGNKSELARGEAFHLRTAALETLARIAARLGWWLLALGFVVATTFLLLKMVAR